MFFTLLMTLAACDQSSSTTPAAANASGTAAPTPTRTIEADAASVAKAPPADVPIYTYEVVNVLPHDPTAFTQGLVYLDGAFLESTGLNGQSSLRLVEVQTGRVARQHEVPAAYFAEGLAVIGDKAFQLTWQNHKGFVYGLADFQVEREFSLDGEGWGLTTDGHWLILSDGTDQLQFLDPATFEIKRTVRVSVNGHPAGRLNELEYVKGEVFANIWGADYIVRIDPASGRVTGIVDFSGLLPPQDRNPNTDVLNGIAYDTVGDRLFVTGKRWPKLFEVRLKSR